MPPFFRPPTLPDGLLISNCIWLSLRKWGYTRRQTHTWHTHIHVCNSISIYSNCGTRISTPHSPHVKIEKNKINKTPGKQQQPETYWQEVEGWREFTVQIIFKAHPKTKLAEHSGRRLNEPPRPEAAPKKRKMLIFLPSRKVSTKTQDVKNIKCKVNDKKFKNRKTEKPIRNNKSKA